MNFATTTLALLQTYQFPALFLGSFFFGDTAVLAAAFLASQGVWSVPDLFIISISGTILADVAWFYGGPYLFTFAQRFKWLKYHSDKLLPKIERLGDRPLRLLVISKFIYGTRILTIIYVGWRKLPLIRFFLYNLLGTIMYFTLLISIGFLAGKSIINLLPVWTDIKYATLALIALLLIVKFANAWIRKRYEDRVLP